MPRESHKVPKKQPLLAPHEQLENSVVKILALIDERLQKHREANDDPRAEPELRGNIAELKQLKKIILTKEN